MKILVTGSTGLVGRALVAFLAAGGHGVTRLVRSRPRSGTAEVHWDPEVGSIDMSGLEGLDAVVHLAGESIATGRWTARKKSGSARAGSRGRGFCASRSPGWISPPGIGVCFGHWLLWGSG